MPAAALARRIDPQTPQQPGKQPRIPRKVVHAIRLMLSGECSTIKAAAERAGLTREWLSKMLGRVHVQAFIAGETRKTIAAGQMRASARLVELVDAGSEHVSLDAAKHVLAIEGIKPPDQGQVAVNVGVSVGYVINLSGETASHTETITQTGEVER
jgi:hypothetical protein